MTLEVTLWAIPVASLAAASVLIVLRAWRLTRDSAVANAILAQAGKLALPPEPPPEAAIEISVVADSATVSLIPNRRLCPVPIVVCVVGRREATLAG